MAPKPFSRRDFLKMASLLPAAYFSLPLLKGAVKTGAQDRANIILIVFDACSANNLSLYGYPVPTSPNLDRFAENAFVYRHHASPGNFTTPGTASLVTGLYPWSHRAFPISASITKKHEEHHIFQVLSSDYATLGYAQNRYADIFLNQASGYIKTHIPRNEFNLQKDSFYTLPFFSRDAIFVGWPVADI